MQSSMNRHSWNPKIGTNPSLLKGEHYRAQMSEVIDGDGVRLIVYVGNSEALVEVRLFGIDAPEHNQQQGSEATDTLQSLFRNRTNDWRLLVTSNRKSYGRTIGLLYHSDSSPEDSVNRKMVELGMAYWDADYARKGEYGIAEAELMARIGRKGLWIDTSLGGDRPWVHRRREEDDDFIWEQREQELDTAKSKALKLERELSTTKRELQHAKDHLASALSGSRGSHEQLATISAERDEARARLSRAQEVIRKLQNAESDSRFIPELGYAVDSDGVNANGSREDTQQSQRLKRELQSAQTEASNLRNENARLQAQYLATQTPWLVRLRRFLIGH